MHVKSGSLNSLNAKLVCFVDQYKIRRASLIAQFINHLPAMQDTQVQFLGRERSPGEGNGNPLQCSCLADPIDRGAWWATVRGVARLGHDLATKPPSAPETWEQKVTCCLNNSFDKWVHRKCVRCPDIWPRLVFSVAQYFLHLGINCAVCFVRNY